MHVTPKIAASIASDEGIVLEAYKDSVGVWTWGVGVTSASGHDVSRYIDNPQTMTHVFDVFMWLLDAKYAPAVRRAFKGVNLTEAQFGAALSFHYNTGAIGRASWVKHFVAGDVAAARKGIMNWTRAGNDKNALATRRKRERALFFDGVWHGGNMATVYSVRKPSYQPNFRKGRTVDVLAEMTSPKATTAQLKPKTAPQIAQEAASEPVAGVWAGIIAALKSLFKGA